MSERDWSSFALLLVDVQRDFWSDEIAAAAPSFPARVGALLTLCRGEGIDIAHARAVFQPDRSDWMPRYRLGRALPCIAGSGGEEPLDVAVDHPGEPVFHKQSYDALLVPELRRWLRDSNKQFLLVAGLLTSVCVFLSAASAAQQGFLVAIVDDASADVCTHHDATFAHYSFLFDRVSVADVSASYPTWADQLARLATDERS